MVAMVISKNVGVNINLNGSVPNGMREKITIVDQSASSDWINAQITNVADIENLTKKNLETIYKTISDNTDWLETAQLCIQND